jgi:hypothetical protein
VSVAAATIEDSIAVFFKRNIFFSLEVVSEDVCMSEKQQTNTKAEKKRKNMRLASYILFGVAGFFGILSIILLVVYLRTPSSYSSLDGGGGGGGRFRRIFRRGGRGGGDVGFINDSFVDVAQ